MRQILIIIMLCASVTAGAAFALEPLPAPKAPGSAKAAADTGDTSDAGKKHGKGKTAKAAAKDASAKDASAKDDSSKQDDSSKGDDAKGDAADDDSKDSSDSKSVAESKPPGDTSFGDSRIKMLLYDESDVYTITTRYGYQTNVVFSPQEEIELISVGDRSLWQIIPSGNRMFIRPMEEDVITNMTVLTNKHSYQFDLKSLPADKTGNIYVAKFVYESPRKAGPIADTLLPASMVPPNQNGMPSGLPASSPFGVGPSIPSQPQATVAPVLNGAPPVVQAQMAPPAQVVYQAQPMQTQPMQSQAMPPMQTQPMQSQAMPPMQPQPVQTASMQPAPLVQATPMARQETVMSSTVANPNFSYTYSGPDELAPLQVYDDGHFTYLKYADAKKLSPSVYTVDLTGKENPVGYSIKGDYMVIEAVAGEMALKSNNNVVHVFNEMLNPG